MSTLATRDLTIRFGGHVAVNAVTCSFEPGTLTAIVGPNGAGKTTYFNLISGQLKASSGRSCSMGGRDLTGMSPSRSARVPGWAGRFSSPTCSPTSACWRTCAWLCRPRAGGTHRRGLNLWSIWSDHGQLTARAEEILQSVAMFERARHRPWPACRTATSASSKSLC